MRAAILRGEARCRANGRAGAARGIAVFLLAFAILAAACSQGAGELIHSSSQAAGPTSPLSEPDVSFDITYPAGTNVNLAVVGAGESLDLGASAKILGIDGSPGTITSVGSEPEQDATTIKPQSRVGTIVSVPNILIGPDATASVARSSG